MDEDETNGANDPQSSDASHESYEPPEIVVLGSLEDLTRGPVGVGGDLNGMVISF